MLFSSCQSTPAENLPTLAAPTTPPTESYPLNFPVSTQLAWFYKPPINASIADITKYFKFFILTKGDEDARNTLLSLKANRPILRYVRIDAIMDPESCDAKPYRNQAAFLPGDFCKISTEHPDWFLLDINGQRIYKTDSGKMYYYMDPGNQGWRDFFLSRLWDVYRSDPKWDGVFLDNIEASFEIREQRKKMPQAYLVEESYVEAIQGFLEYIHKGFFSPANQKAYGNIIAIRDEADFTRQITYLDGAMHESWTLSKTFGYRGPDEWEKHLTLAEDTQKMGKYIVLVAQGSQEDFERQKFAFASYMLINRGLASFRYANSDVYNQAWLYENYSIDLGQPTGDRYKQGQAWRRDFSNGWVSVNPESHEVIINLGK